MGQVKESLRKELINTIINMGDDNLNVRSILNTMSINELQAVVNDYELTNEV